VCAEDFVAAHESVRGPSATSLGEPGMSAFEGEVVVPQTWLRSEFDPNLPSDATRSAIVRGPSAAHYSDGTCTAFLRPDPVKLLCATQTAGDYVGVRARSSISEALLVGRDKG
jgi:hypothetical protein